MSLSENSSIAVAVAFTEMVLSHAKIEVQLNLRFFSSYFLPFLVYVHAAMYRAACVYTDCSSQDLPIL